jgi:hypothetical protein
MLSNPKTSNLSIDPKKRAEAERAILRETLANSFDPLLDFTAFPDAENSMLSKLMDLCMHYGGKLNAARVEFKEHPEYVDAIFFYNNQNELLDSIHFDHPSSWKLHEFIRSTFRSDADDTMSYDFTHYTSGEAAITAILQTPLESSDGSSSLQLVLVKAPHPTYFAYETMKS